MIDLATEKLLTLSQAADHCPRPRRGKKQNTSTLFRWATRGCRGVILETIRTSSGLATSVQALQRFFNLLTAGEQTLEPAPTARKGTRHEAVERELAKFGL